jgi:hypothetical protein
MAGIPSPQYGLNSRTLNSSILEDSLTPVPPAQTSQDEKTTFDSSLETADGREPTDEEIDTLRHVSDHIPLNVWLVAGISLTERFTYYGINSPFRKFSHLDFAWGKVL